MEKISISVYSVYIFEYNAAINAKDTSNSTSYYPLLAQFGRNRFHFNPAPPKKGVNIPYNNIYHQKGQQSNEFPKVSGRNSVLNASGNFQNHIILNLLVHLKRL